MSGYYNQNNNKNTGPPPPAGQQSYQAPPPGYQDSFAHPTAGTPVAVPAQQPQQPYMQSPQYNQQPYVAPPPGANGYSRQYDEDDELEGGPKLYADFNERSVRLGFIRKVYGILSLQLFVTFGISLVFVLNESVKNYVQRAPGLMFLAMIATFVCLIVLACAGDIRKKSPHNMIFLGIFTFCEGYLIGTVTTFYSVNEVVTALAMTAICVLGVTLFACQTKIDFTLCGGFLFCTLLVFILAGFFMMFFPSHTGNLIYSIIGALIFVFYLLYDTQLMMGGDHAVSISPEEHVFAALNLYLDIINLFLYLLRILRELDR
eukprot:Nk52_evm37s967 gene=Nk52_evmTU37s967